jgi:hypothetical protein
MAISFVIPWSITQSCFARSIPQNCHSEEPFECTQDLRQRDEESLSWFETNRTIIGIPRFARMTSSNPRFIGEISALFLLTPRAHLKIVR